MNIATPARHLLQTFFLTFAACVAFSVPQAARAYEDGWRTCADEGQICRVNGRAVVRYGAEGRWTSRSVVNGVECNNDAFGDPAPGDPKRCQVRVSGYDGSGSYRETALGWSFCAAEGEICRFRGQAEVRFGQGNSFVTRTAYDGVRCDVSDFGDPIRGVTKFCEIRRSGGQRYENSSQGSWDGWGSGASAGGWRYCAAEGETCRVRGRALVRFGDGRNFKTRNVNGEVACDAGIFGDPARGVTKHCEVQANAYGQVDTSDWRRCAVEGEICNFRGSVQARFGTAGRYVYRDGVNGVYCSTDFFGADPYPGRAKSCEIRR